MTDNTLDITYSQLFQLFDSLHIQAGEAHQAAQVRQILAGLYKTHSSLSSVKDEAKEVEKQGSDETKEG